MRKRVTKEEFEMLFASCGYIVTEVWEAEGYYFVSVRDQVIEIAHIKLLEIEGLELYAIGGAEEGNRAEVQYYRLDFS